MQSKQKTINLYSTWSQPTSRNDWPRLLATLTATCSRWAGNGRVPQYTKDSKYSCASIQTSLFLNHRKSSQRASPWQRKKTIQDTIQWNLSWSTQRNGPPTRISLLRFRIQSPMFGSQVSLAIGYVLTMGWRRIRTMTNSGVEDFSRKRKHTRLRTYVI